MPLASDLHNPDFVGAKNPDSGLYVEFYWHEAVDGWASREKSNEQQRNVVVKLPKAPFVRIMVPGDKTSEFTTAVTEAHKQRFPREWMAWQIAEGLIGGEGDIPGWKISEWEEVNPDMCRELLYLRFQTVEQLAGASDKQIQGIGIGGLALREKARVALRNKMGAETREAIEAERAEKDELKREVSELRDMMKQFLAAQTAMPAPAEPAPEVPAAVVTEAAEKRGPGRPAKAI